MPRKCEGPIDAVHGCLLYYGSDEQVDDAGHEGMMRSGGLGFGTHFNPSNSAMSMHLQAQHDLSPDEVEAILLAHTAVTPE